MASPPSDFNNDAVTRRRESMRRELLGAMRAHHDRRRRRRRTSAALLLAIALSALLWQGLPRLDGPSGLAVNDDGAPLPAPTDSAGPGSTPMIYEVVTTRAGATRQYIQSPPTMIELIDDRELLRNLASLNRPAGIVRVGDQVSLTRPVADAIERPQ